MTVSNQKFFLVVQPDAENLASKELAKWTENLPISGVEVLHGGIQFDAPLNIGLALNYVLKIPSRILLRLEQFKCREFKKFEHKLTQINWGNFAGQGDVKFHINSQASRLYHKKKLEEFANKAYEKYRMGQPASKKEDHHNQVFYINFNEDICSISVDTTGEHLHKRGYKKLTTEAPLRETIASTLIQQFIEETQINVNQYYLIDPFCGSGTLLGEAFYLNQSLKGKRPYSFESFKLYRKILDKFEFSSQQTNGFKGYFGFDKEPEAISAAKTNLKELKELHLDTKDVLDFSQANHPCVVLTNPPYGDRLKEINLESALSYINKNYVPDFVGIYLAKSQGIIKSNEFKLNSKFSLKNTKIPAQLLIYEKIR